MDLHGKDPLVDASAEWMRSANPERQRTVERHRHKRRARPQRSAIRARIRVRVWLACTGALLLMGLSLYFVLGHQGG